MLLLHSEAESYAHHERNGEERRVEAHPQCLDERRVGKRGVVLALQVVEEGAESELNVEGEEEEEQTESAAHEEGVGEEDLVDLVVGGEVVEEEEPEEATAPTVAGLLFALAGQGSRFVLKSTESALLGWG